MLPAITTHGRKKLLSALLLAVLTTLWLVPLPAYSADGDSDNDGVPEAEDNCPNVSNALQRDEVTAFQLNSWHDGNKIYPNPDIRQVPPIYKPVWVPKDRTNVRIYLAGNLTADGVDYEWVEEGMVGIDYLDPRTKIRIFPTSRAGKLLMVILGDSDGSGNKCSDNLGRDFDGIPAAADNCPVDYNPYQEDTFGSPEQGDACESSPATSSKTLQQKRDDLATALYPYAQTASNAEISRIYAETSSADYPISQAYATLYVGNNYTGTPVTFRTDNRSLVSTDIGDNAASSIKVGPHTEVTLYTDANYGGTAERFYLDDTDFVDNGIGDNTVSSLQLVSTMPIRASVFEQKSEADMRTELTAAGFPDSATASKSEIELVYTRTAAGYASTKLIQLWSGTQGFVGHILPSELEAAVGGGKGTVLELQKTNRKTFKSVQLTYNGNGEYEIATTNLDGTGGETTDFHYAGIPDTTPQTPTPTGAVTATLTPTPSAAGSTTQSQTYIVKAGDYLSTIAARYGTTAYALVIANNIVSANLIYASQELTIPSTSNQ